MLVGPTPSFLSTDSVAIISMLYGRLLLLAIPPGGGMATFWFCRSCGVLMFESDSVRTCITFGAASYPSAISRSLSVPCDCW